MQSTFADNQDYSQGNETGLSGNSFFEATRLARRGSYSEAVRLLGKALESGECSEVQALDLRARIYVQQGLHLEAEACWLKARELDGGNPDYDRALRRLRRERLPGSRMPQWTALVAGAAALALLVWQVALVNPAVVESQDAAETSLTEIARAVSQLQAASLSRDAEAASRSGTLEKRLERLETGLSRRMDELAKTSASQARSLTARLAQTTGEAERTIRRDIAGLAANRLQDESVRLSKLETLQTHVTGIDGRLKALDQKLVEGLRGTEEALRSALKSLPRMEETSAVREALSELRSEMRDLITKVEESNPK